MHFTLTQLATLACVATALAVPTAPKAKPKKAIKIDQVDIGKKFRSGPIQMLETYKKFHKKPPAKVIKAAEDAQSGSVTASPTQYDSEYICQVSVGGQTLNLDFDTGSSDLWVFSTLMGSSEQSGHNVYNPNNSGQSESGETWQISYGDGSGASGVVYADTVVIGGVTATSQAVEAATSASSQFVQNTNDDGLVGLAFQSINTCSPNQCTTFFNTVESSLQDPVFTADLKAGQPGSYTFGYIDSSLYSGNIQYVSVDNSQGFWGFTAGGYAVGGGSTSGSIGSAIADTGTSLWYLPTDVASAYWGQVSGSSNSEQYGGYVFPCSASLPDMTVNIGGSDFTVPGSYMNYSPASSDGNTCFGGIQANTNIGMSIFGDIFLKAVYVVFSPNEPQIGFAAQS